MITGSPPAVRLRLNSGAHAGAVLGGNFHGIEQAFAISNPSFPKAAFRTSCSWHLLRQRSLTAGLQIRAPANAAFFPSITVLPLR